jgi:hypothetical protein
LSRVDCIGSTSQSQLPTTLISPLMQCTNRPTNMHHHRHPTEPTSLPPYQRPTSHTVHHASTPPPFTHRERLTPTFTPPTNHFDRPSAAATRSTTSPPQVHPEHHHINVQPNTPPQQSIQSTQASHQQCPNKFQRTNTQGISTGVSAPPYTTSVYYHCGRPSTPCTHSHANISSERTTKSSARPNLQHRRLRSPTSVPDTPPTTHFAQRSIQLASYNTFRPTLNITSVPQHISPNAQYNYRPTTHYAQRAIQLASQTHHLQHISPNAQYN